MKIEIAVAIIAGVFSIAAAGFTYYSARQTDANTKQIEEIKRADDEARATAEKQEAMSKFSEPLTRAAYDLQSRIYNILKQGLVEVYLSHGNDREKSYVIDNTVYLIAQYFCYVELARQEVRFIDLGENERTRIFQNLQDDIASKWLSDAYPPILRIFAGEQRAIGEALIQDSPRGLDCIGYGAFLKKYPLKADPLLDSLRLDVSNLSLGGLEPSIPRLKSIQNSLIDLLNLLDPNSIRFPVAKRSKA